MVPRETPIEIKRVPSLFCPPTQPQQPEGKTDDTLEQQGDNSSTELSSIDGYEIPPEKVGELFLLILGVVLIVLACFVTILN